MVCIFKNPRGWMGALSIGMLCSLTNFASAAPLETYFAYLGPDDHFNSKGARLTQPWQVIRQDRANYHRFGIRDQSDNYDSFFSSKANRARMERMILNGYIDRSSGQRIVNQNVNIKVEIFDNAVNVTVFD